jgi:hypothetical protein
MLAVTARKIRDHSRDHPNVGVGRVYTGFLISLPVAGHGMVIFRDPHGHRMITTPVRRVLRDADGGVLWVDTENSVYRVTLHGAVPPPVESAAPRAAKSTGSDR